MLAKIVASILIRSSVYIKRLRHSVMTLLNKHCFNSIKYKKPLLCGFLFSTIKENTNNIPFNNMLFNNISNYNTPNNNTFSYNYLVIVFYLLVLLSFIF